MIEELREYNLGISIEAISIQRRSYLRSLSFSSYLPFIRITQSPEKPIKEHGEVTIVVFVRGMMNRMETSSHDTPHIAIDTIVDVGCPDCLEEDQHLVSEKVHRLYK